jgi:hypothetical protein
MKSWVIRMIVRRCSTNHNCMLLVRIALCGCCRWRSMAQACVRWWRASVHIHALELALQCLLRRAVHRWGVITTFWFPIGSFLLLGRALFLSSGALPYNRRTVRMASRFLGRCPWSRGSLHGCLLGLRRRYSMCVGSTVIMRSLRTTLRLRSAPDLGRASSHPRCRPTKLMRRVLGRRSRWSFRRWWGPPSCCCSGCRRHPTGGWPVLLMKLWERVHNQLRALWRIIFERRSRRRRLCPSRALSYGMLRPPSFAVPERRGCRVRIAVHNGDMSTWLGARR